MSVPLASRSIRYVATGGQTVFPYAWLALAETDFQVTRLRSGLTQPLVLNLDYTVTGIGSETGGTIVLTAGAAAGDVIAIEGAQPIQRASDFSDSGDFRAQALNAELDRLVIAQQQLDAARLRSIRVPATDSTTGTELAPAENRKSTVFGFDSAGVPVLYPSTPALAPPGAVFVDARASYGAVGDDATDNTTALQNAANAAAAINGVLVIPDGAYRLTGTLTLPGGAAGLVMHGELVKAGAGIGLILGDGGTVRNGEKFYSNIRVRRATQSDWASEGDIGVLARNLDRSWLHLAEARGFTIGLRTLGDQRGFEDTTVVLGALIDNKIGLDIRTQTASGWNNSVRYIGGHFAVSGGLNPTIGTFGVRLSNEPGAYSNHNGHSFYGPNFELDVSGRPPPAGIPFRVNVSGRGLHACGVRMENCAGVVASHTAAMKDAIYEVLWTDQGYLVGAEYDSATATRAGAVVRTLSSASGQHVYSRLVAAVDNVRAAAFRESDGNTGFEGLCAIGGTSGNFAATTLRGASDAGYVLSNFGVTIAVAGRGLAFPIFTGGCRDFALALHADENARVVVRLFDGLGGLLDNTTNFVLASEHTMTWNGTTGWWETSAALSDGNLNRLIHLHLGGTGIVSAQIGVARIGSDVLVQAMRLYCDPRFAPAVRVGSPDLNYVGSRRLPFSAAYNPPLMSSGTTQFTSVTVAGAVPGDSVEIGFSIPSTSIVWLGQVGGTDSVTAVVWNRGPVNVDLGDGTLFGQVVKPLK